MTAPSIKEALELKPCPFCGCEDIKFNHPNKEKGWRGSINCPACLVTMPRECGDQELIDCWNERSALATFQPDGERREAIARILADPKHQERARYVQGFLYGDDHVIRDVALRENQELFRTKDEHEYEQRLEIEKAKFAAGAIIASGLVQNEAGEKISLLLRMIDAAGGEIDATENVHSLLNYFCDDRGSATDTYNLAIDQGLIGSSFDSMFETSRAWLTDAGRAALAQSVEKK